MTDKTDEVDALKVEIELLRKQLVKSAQEAQTVWSEGYTSGYNVGRAEGYSIGVDEGISMGQMYN